MIQLVLFGLFAYWMYWNFLGKRSRLPPGPTPLPILGNLLDIARREPGEDQFIEWRKRYGDVYTYWVGEEPIVSVNEFNQIQEAFVKDADSYTGRPYFAVMDELVRGKSALS